MAKLYKTNGEVVEIEPKNGKKFTLEEVQSYVEGYVERVELKHNEVLLCNEEAILYCLPYNKHASDALTETYGPNSQALFGNIIHCLRKQF
jgi:hypothetical protein